MRKAIICAVLAAMSLPAGGQEGVAEQDIGARYQSRGAVAGGSYSQAEIDAKLGQINAEMVNLREVNTLRTESVAREAEGARAYIDRVLLIAVLMLAVIMYLLVNGFRHQMNNQGLRLRRMLKEGETLMADVERLLNRPDVENYRASRKLSEIKAQLKESSDRMLPQLSVRNIYEVASDPNLPACLFVQAKAIKAEQAGDWRGAAAHWEEVIALDSKDPDNYLHLAHTYRNLSRSVTGEEHEVFLQKSLSYYQEYANRTKGLHDAFAQQAPPAPSDILAEQIRVQQQQAVQPPPSRQPVTAYRPEDYGADSVMYQAAIPVAVPQASQPASSWWRRRKPALQPVQVVLQPVAGIQPVPAQSEQPVQPVQTEQPAAVQPELQFPEGAQQTAMVPAAPAAPAAPAPPKPPKSPGKPLFTSVKKTAGSIGNSAERTITRGMTALRSVKQTLAEGRRRQKEGISVFSAGEGENNVAAVDAAMSETGVAQAEITAGRQPVVVGGSRLARRIPLPGAGLSNQRVNGGAPKDPAPIQAAGAKAESVQSDTGGEALDAVHADAGMVEAAGAAAERNVQEPQEAEAAASPSVDHGRGSGEQGSESPASPAELPLQYDAPEPPAAGSNGREAAAGSMPAANGKANGNANGKTANGDADVTAGQSDGSGLHANGETTLEHAQALFNKSMELIEEDQGKALGLVEEALGIYEQVHARESGGSELCKSWGFALVAKAMATKGNKQRGVLFREAADKLMEGNLHSDSKHENDFAIASLYALAGDERRCKKWLAESRDSGTLNADAMRTVPEFEKMRGKPWFNRYLEDTAS